jgi:hypothetical protein
MEKNFASHAGRIVQILDLFDAGASQERQGMPRQINMKLCCQINGKYQCTTCEEILCCEELKPENWFEDGRCNHIGLRDWPMTGMTYSRARS